MSKRSLLHRVAPITVAIALSLGGGVITWITYDSPVTKFLTGNRATKNSNSIAHKVWDTSAITMHIALILAFFGLLLKAAKVTDSENSINKAFMLTLGLLLFNLTSTTLAYNFLPQAEEFTKAEQPKRGYSANPVRHRGIAYSTR